LLVYRVGRAVALRHVNGLLSKVARSPAAGVESDILLHMLEKYRNLH